MSEENTEECIEWSPALTTVAVTTEDLNRKDGEEISGNFEVPNWIALS